MQKGGRGCTHLQALGAIFVLIGVINTTHRQLTGMIWCVRFRAIVLLIVLQRKQTLSSGYALGLSSFTAIIPWHPVNNYNVLEVTSLSVAVAV